MKIDYDVGDVVVCIVNDGGFQYAGLPSVSLRELYTVKGIRVDTRWCTNGCNYDLAIRLEHREPPWPFDGSGYEYCACSFRKAFTPDADVSRERELDVPSRKRSVTAFIRSLKDAAQ